MSIAAEDAGVRDARKTVEAVLERGFQAFHRYFAVRLADEHAVDDLMQQLWIKARRHGVRVRCAGQQAEAWLWSVARNLLREHWRAHARRLDRVPIARPDVARELARRFDTECLPGEQVQRREIRDQLMLAVTSLPIAEQELLIGQYFEGLSLRELSQRVGASVRAIEGRLYRARRALRDRLHSLQEPN